MTTSTKSNTAVLTGAAIAFLAFLVIGAIPGLLYGGYLGLIMGNALFGHTSEISLIARMMTGGGMLLGFFAVMSVFLVAGSILGSVFGSGIESIQKATKELPDNVESK